jgi:hypothetical protein
MKRFEQGPRSASPPAAAEATDKRSRRKRGSPLKTTAKLEAEIEELRRQLGEAQDALRAIHEGQVDAIVVDSEQGRTSSR